MESLQHFFSHPHQFTDVMIFTVLFLICWNLENIFGVTEDYKKWKHCSTNFYFILSGGLVQALTGYFFIRIIVFENEHHYGFSAMSDVRQVIFSFIFLDFIYYVYHVLMHRFKTVWRFHAIHHSDTVLNVSTSLREHPVETVIRLSQYMFFCVLIGPAFWIIALHQFIQVASKIIIHSNFRLPDRLDKYLSYIFITPNMHHVHHHHVRPYTDSNYGDLFSVWDHVFGTFTYLAKEDVQFGLDEVQDELTVKPLKLFTTRIFQKR
jgi:sterol desaturase/sphingolipid hydroxylase (fatty acid hydroxylase superfamily)